MLHPSFRRVIALGLVALLGACVRLIPPGSGTLPPVRPAPTPPASVPTPVPSPTPPANALVAGVRPGPAIATLGLDQPGAARVLAAFVASCPRLALLPDRTGLVQSSDWTAPCNAAASWPATDAPRFFAENFEPAVVGDGKTFVTGYYEPEISGVRVRQPGFDVPIYALPPDLVRANAALPPPIASPAPLAGTPAPPTLGRTNSNGTFVPYYSRAEIEDGALAGRGLEIAWAADPAEFFFLQIQGSGRLVGPDGQVMRIGYAGQNGLPYTAIGALMKARGLLGDAPGQYASSMQGIVRYLHEHPAEGRALMREDASYVFFRELTGLDPSTGPVGAMNLPVRAQTSLAADPRYVPWGAPVFLTTDRPPANGLWIAQDTGGAIRGPNRFDSFWGAGAEARRIAGGLDGRGTAVILLPRGVLARAMSAPPPR